MIISDRFKIIERKLEKLSNTDLSMAENFSAYDMRDIENFSDWIDFSVELKGPDIMKAALYFGFQPLYDCLVEGKVEGSERGKALEVLGYLNDFSIKFLSGYYTGEADTTLLKQAVEKIKPALPKIAHLPYNKKARRLGDTLFEQDVKVFLQTYIEHIFDRQTTLPDYVIGCACGSSEIAMPLAGLLGTKLGFIRFSTGRYDSDPKTIPEHEDTIAENVKGRSVACVDDTCSHGKSMGAIMKRVKSYGPSSLVGSSVKSDFHYYLSINSDNPGVFLKELAYRKNFNLFGLK